MTPSEQKAREIVKLHTLSAHFNLDGCGDTCECDDGVCEVAVSAISKAIDDAVREERERAWEACWNGFDKYEMPAYPDFGDHVLEEKFDDAVRTVRDDLLNIVRAAIRSRSQS